MDYCLTAQGTNLAYRDQGRGTPVVLIHGWPLNSDMFEYQTYHLLKNGFRVVTYDRRGFGRSSHEADGYSFETLSSDLRDLVNKLELQKFHLVGFSMGGGEIASYLARFGSERVLSATLVASVVPFVMQTDSNPEGVPQEKLKLIQQSLLKNRPEFLAEFAKDFYGIDLLHHGVGKETLDWTAVMANQASLLATIDCVDTFGRTDFRSHLGHFDVPTLIIHGDADKTVPIYATAQRASQLIPHAIYKIYEGAPHGLFATHKDRLNADLVEFLMGVPLRTNADAQLKDSPEARV